MTMTETPGPLSTRILPAGVKWDAVRVPRFMGLAVLDRMQSSPGSVIVDPQERALYFFVPKGATSSWDLAEVRLLRGGQFLVVPPSDRFLPPGPYWLVEPGHWLSLASPEELHSTLGRAVNDMPQGSVSA